LCERVAKLLWPFPRCVLEIDPVKLGGKVPDAFRFSALSKSWRKRARNGRWSCMVWLAHGVTINFRVSRIFRQIVRRFCGFVRLSLLNTLVFPIPRDFRRCDRAIYLAALIRSTNGHLDVIERARKLFDEVVVVCRTTTRKHLFSHEGSPDCCVKPAVR